MKHSKPATDSSELSARLIFFRLEKRCGRVTRVRDREESSHTSEFDDRMLEIRDSIRILLPETLNLITTE